MHLVLIVFGLISTAVHAQYSDWGLGLDPATACPGMGPAGNAMSPRDQPEMLANQIEDLGVKIEENEEKIEAINEKLAKAKAAMGQVLSKSSIEAVVYHREGKKSRSDYAGCPVKPPPGAPATTTAAAGPGNDLYGTGGGGGDSLRPVPRNFCAENDQGQTVNTWDRIFANDDGTVEPTICERYVKGVSVGPNAPYDGQKSSDCVKGLNTFYSIYKKKEELQAKNNKLKVTAEKYGAKLEKINDQISEATYCYSCAARSMAMGGRGMSPLGAAGQNRSILDMMGVQQALSQPAGMAGPQSFMAQPYAARVPGYYGMGPNNRYGSVPGASLGGFGCPGGGQFAHGQPNFNPGYFPMDPGANFAMNPYRQGPPGMSMPGAGPWGPNGGYGIHPPPMMTPGGYRPGMVPPMNQFFSGAYPGFGNGGYANVPGLADPSVLPPIAGNGGSYFDPRFGSLGGSDLGPWDAAYSQQGHGAQYYQNGAGGYGGNYISPVYNQGGLPSSYQAPFNRSW